jgi:hypothetical protein
MADNPSFVMRKINETIFEDRPIPESEDYYFLPFGCQKLTRIFSVFDDEVLVAIQKTGTIRMGLA